jgi:hypothetical protein
MIMMKRTAVAVVFFVLLSLPLNVIAGIAPSPFLLPDLAGFDNPMFWVMFNPQPEPPGSWYTDYSNDIAPVITVHFNSNQYFTSFPVAFGIQNGQNATVSLTVPNRPTVNGHEIVFSIYQGSFGLELAYTATFSFGSDVIPQPEPPGVPWTFFLQDNAGGPFQGRDVAMTLRLTDGDNNPVVLRSVPESTTMLLLGLGLASLAGFRRNLRRR